MRRKYSIGVALLLAAAAAFAAQPCPTELAATASRVSALRHLATPLAPPCRWVAQDQVRRVLDTKLRHDLPLPPELFLESLTRLGLIDADPPGLYSRLLDFYASQVLGFYEPSTDSMVLVANPVAPSSTAPLVWAHELEHAAQEHLFHLPSRLLGMADDGDAQRAASAMAEGDAMLVMFVLNAPPDAPADTLDAAAATLANQAEATEPPPGLPRYFVADLTFPYAAGFSTVLAAYRRGGWPAVNALLADPPPSTADLLHPDDPVQTPPVGDGELPAAPAGFTTVTTDTLGEWGLRFLLARHLPAKEAERVAAGWAGDRLRLVRSDADPGRWGLAWRLRCRSAGARRELLEALRHVLPAALSGLRGHGRPTSLVAEAVAGSSRDIEVLAAWPEATSTAPRR